MVANATGDVNSADSFILLGFGINRASDGRLTPGASNLALAQWLLQNNPDQKPTITQEGTYLALQSLLAATASTDWITNLPHDDKVHVDTFGAALQIWLLAEQHGWRRPCLVTHPWQSDRAYRIFRQLPFDTLIVPAIDAATIPFDAASIQRWTRNWGYYMLFEFVLARPIGRIFGWLR